MQTTRIENCDEHSIIKVLPNAKAFINRNCEYVVDICHNVTVKLNAVSANLIVYSSSIEIQNSTSAADCKSYKKIKNREVIRMVSAISGFSECENFKPGMVCKNETAFKLKDTLRAINLIKQTSRNGNTYEIFERIVFENGAISCIKAEAVSRKY